MRIVLANLKKPALETRLAGKIFWWLKPGIPKTIYLFGKPIPARSGQESKELNLIREDIFSSHTTWKNYHLFWLRLKEIKPSLILSPSPELVFVALLYKQTHPCEVIWDVQENHALNIWHQEVYKGWRKFLWSGFMTVGTRFLSSMVNGRIFAEHIYQDQLPFIGLPGLILENKAPVAWNVQRQLPQPERKILFSGFISRESGILTALALWKKSTLSQKSWTLEIIGFCPSEELRNQIMDETRHLPEVKIQDLSIWHSDLEIEACLKTSFAILATYRESIANAGKVPTKFWEAGFLGRWIVCSHLSAFLPLLNKGFPIAHFQEDATDPLGFLEEWYNLNKLPAPNSRMGFASYL